MGLKEGVKELIDRALHNEEPDKEMLQRKHELSKLKIETGIAFSWNNFFKYFFVFLLGAIFVGTALLLGGLKYGSPLISSTITTPLEGNIQYLIDFETDVDFKGYFVKDKFKMLEKKNLSCTELYDYKIIEHVLPTILEEDVEYQKLLDGGWTVFKTQEFEFKIWGNTTTKGSGTILVQPEHTRIALRKSQGNCEYITVEKDVGSPKFIPTNLTVKNLKIKTSGSVGLNTTFSALIDEFVKRYTEKIKKGWIYA